MGNALLRRRLQLYTPLTKYVSLVCRPNFSNATATGDITNLAYSDTDGRETRYVNTYAIARITAEDVQDAIAHGMNYVHYDCTISLVSDRDYTTPYVWGNYFQRAYGGNADPTDTSLWTALSSESEFVLESSGASYDLYHFTKSYSYPLSYYPNGLSMGFNIQWDSWIEPGCYYVGTLNIKMTETA